MTAVAAAPKVKVFGMRLLCRSVTQAIRLITTATAYAMFINIFRRNSPGTAVPTRPEPFAPLAERNRGSRFGRSGTAQHRQYQWWRPITRTREDPGHTPRATAYVRVP